eukprot:maker-scaffold_36-snap-gene-1.4-mRNA-1 protein AED:0.05 eAED:0.05 QI:14/1/0.66/1/1/1/3/1104/106
MGTSISRIKYIPGKRQGLHLDQVIQQELKGIKDETFKIVAIGGEDHGRRSIQRNFHSLTSEEKPNEHWKKLVSDFAEIFFIYMEEVLSYFSFEDIIKTPNLESTKS